MVLGKKRVLFLIGNGAEIWPIEKGRKSPGISCSNSLEASQSVLIRAKKIHSSTY